jgi:hypothetical protein
VNSKGLRILRKYAPKSKPPSPYSLKLTLQQGA